MARARRLRVRAVGAGFLCVVGLLMLVGVAQGSPWPPAEGDWVIEVGEEVTLTDEDLTLPANVIVYGRLVLNNCVLWFAPSGFADKGLVVLESGRVDGTDTWVTSTSHEAQFEGVAAIVAGGTSVNSFTHCRFDPVYGHFQDQSHNSFTDCEFSRGTWTVFRGDSQNVLVETTFNSTYAVFGDRSVNSATECFFAAYWTVGGWASQDSRNTFINCTLKGFEFHSPSVSTLDGCDFVALNPDGSGGTLAIYAGEHTVLSLSDLAPGYHASYLVQASNNPFRVELRDTAMHEVVVKGYDDAVLTLTRCELTALHCNAHSQTELVDTQIGSLFVYTHGQPYTANVIVRNFRDGGVPQTTDIISDNSPFRLSLRNSSVSSSVFFFGDTGDPPTPSQNLIEDSEIWWALVCEDSSLEVRRSTLVAGVGGYATAAEATAQLVAEDCELTGLQLDGSATRAIVRRSVLAGGLLYFGSYWQGDTDNPIPSAPALVWEQGSSWRGGDPRVEVWQGTTAARISGEVDIGPSRCVSRWDPGSTIIRQFPVLVTDEGATPLPGAEVWVTEAGGSRVWPPAPPVVTDVEGKAYPEVTFDDSDYDSEFRVHAKLGTLETSGPLGFLSSTPIVLRLATQTISYTSFEEERYPWMQFGAGLGEASVWRQVGGALTWRGMAAPAAHSGEYEVMADVAGEGTAGLRLDLPATPSWPLEYRLRGWAYVEERAGAASSFFGYRFAEDYPSPTAPWTADLGWEPTSGTGSTLRLAGSSASLPVGLSAGRWHLVEVKYSRLSDLVSVWVNGEEVVTDHPAPGAAGRGPTHAVLGAWGGGGGARQLTCFDDVSMKMSEGTPGSLSGRLVGNVKGPGVVLTGQTESYRVRYGNGYPVQGLTPSPGDDTPQPLYVTLALPAGYELVGWDREPLREANGQAVWQVNVPYLGEENYLLLDIATPTGGSGGYAGDLRLWETLDAGAAVSDPPNPPDPEVPYDEVWGYPKDLLAQLVVAGEGVRPDLWVRKKGPLTASPGDQVTHTITVGNQGFAEASSWSVKDYLPEALGGGAQIPRYLSLAPLLPGERRPGLVTRMLKWGTPSGPIENVARTWTDQEELGLGNNESSWTTQVVAARDPNAISVDPEGGVERGDLLTYTIECENVGAGTAYGVYATAELNRQLDDGSLALPGSMSYDPSTRTLVWEVGTLGPSEGASATFTVKVAGRARRARPVIGQATVYFPSVPEETPTNIVVNVVHGSFPDVPWDHWAVGEIESTFEVGIVQGYPNGEYRPAIVVTRDQMAVFVARALAGGDANVPTGPETPSFSDVDTDHWAYQYIEYAVDQEVVEGYPNGTYRPANPVDRGQMAVFMARAMAGGESNVPPPMPPATFPDVAPGTAWEWCWPHVEYIATKGVAGGYEDGTYRPATTCTRDQMAVYVTRGFRLPM